MSRAKAPVVPPEGSQNAPEGGGQSTESVNSASEGINSEAEGPNDEAQKVELVKMVRDDPRYDGPKTADVHPDEVANYMAADWKLTDEPAKPE